MVSLWGLNTAAYLQVEYGMDNLKRTDFNKWTLCADLNNFYSVLAHIPPFQLIRLVCACATIFFFFFFFFKSFAAIAIITLGHSGFSPSFPFSKFFETFAWQCRSLNWAAGENLARGKRGQRVKGWSAKTFLSFLGELKCFRFHSCLKTQDCFFFYYSGFTESKA